MEHAFNDRVETNEFDRFIHMTALKVLQQNSGENNGAGLVDRHMGVTVIGVFHCINKRSKDQ